MNIAICSNSAMNNENELLQSLASVVGDCTSVERRLLDTVRAHPDEVMFMSVRELAQRAGTHESSAVRFARKLGFDGYPAFRRALQSSLVRKAPSDAADRMLHSLSEAASGDILNSLVAKERHSIDVLPQHVTQAQLDAVADRLAAATRVFLWAHGNATILAAMMCKRLANEGVDARNICGEGRDLADALAALRKGDALLIFAFRQEPDALPPMLRYARSSKVNSIVVTDLDRSAFSESPELVLSAPRGDSAGFLTLTVPMLIANAVVLSLAQNTGERALRSLQALDRLRQELCLPAP
jgi:DNA-binding MurR/RpiR family transcriptional regulator